MTRLTAAALILTLVPALAAAHHKPGHAGGPDRADRVVETPATGHCPPGLAKKDPPCVPPGLAKRGDYAVGDRYDGDWREFDRDRFDLPPLAEGEAYVRVGDRILRLDREERIILSIVELVLN
ncbi:hypothetical protein [uncultured Jannaschia sp.]|uniref:hypothetical protein n=1 Tax=uncultured Jannaschia sp. TaxID=293347 RepID=UPI00261EAAA6|nr:hypothetical protein [uncultured Jannaschia sp.]